jgi:hypothetical protein
MWNCRTKKQSLFSPKSFNKDKAKKPHLEKGGVNKDWQRHTLPQMQYHLRWQA